MGHALFDDALGNDILASNFFSIFGLDDSQH